MADAERQPYDPARAASNVEAALQPMLAATSSKGLDEPPPGGKFALVMSGGGAMGVYEAGVLQAFALNGFKFDVLVGTSIGSINAAVYAEYSRRREQPANLPGGSGQYEEADTYLQHFLLFWEYINQAKVIDFDYPPVRAILHDLRNLDVEIGQLVNLWLALTDEALDPEARAAGLRRFFAKARRFNAYIGLAYAISPAVLVSLFRPGDDLYDAIRKGLTQMNAGSSDAPSDELRGSDIRSRLRPILQTALIGYYEAKGPNDPILKSLFSNQAVVNLLTTFPAVTVDEQSPALAAQLAAPSDGQPRVSLPPLSFADYEQTSGIVLRFPRSNARTGQLEVAARLSLEEEVLDTLTWFNKLFGLAAPTLDALKQAAADESETRLRQLHPAEEQVMAVQQGHALLDSWQPSQSEIDGLVDLIFSLETRLAVMTARDGLRLRRSKFVLGNPDLRRAVLASAALQTILPPVTIDQIYPLINPAEHGDPANDVDNAALREVMTLCLAYIATKPPHSRGERVSGLSSAATATWVRHAMQAGVADRAAQLQGFARLLLTSLPVRRGRIAAADLLRCVLSSWHTYYPLLFRSRNLSFREEYNDGGPTDVTPLGNAIDALRDHLHALRSSNAAQKVKEFLDATHHIYFIHLADVPKGVRLTDDGGAVADEPTYDPADAQEHKSSLTPQELNQSLSYEYGLRTLNVSQRAKYLSDAANAQRISRYIRTIKQLQQGRPASDHALADDELLDTNVVNIYPDEMLTSLLGFDRRTGYSHNHQRRMIAMGCANTMETLWRELQKAGSSARYHSLPPEVARNLQERWLTPVAQSDGRQTLYCHNCACMYRAECKLTKVQPTRSSKPTCE